MSFFARFEQQGEFQFRFDTRIYLSGIPASVEDGVCIAAVIGKNPGSAGTSNGLGWQPIQLNGDNMLPSIGNRFLAAYDQANVPVPSLGYVRVWNLFYLCNKVLKQAVNGLSMAIDPQACKTETERPAIVWFAWGGDDKALNRLKARFLQSPFDHPFFYDWRSKAVVPRAPTVRDFAKHTEGLEAQPIVDHLSGLLKVLAT